MKENVYKDLGKFISSLSISDDSKKALKVIAIDPHGFEINAARSFFASVLDLSLERANQVIIELQSKQFLLTEGTRLCANYDKINIDEETQRKLREGHRAYTYLEEPHSGPSMASLEKLFEQTDDTLYISCEVTSHEVFTKLYDRSKRGRKTIFIMPNKSGVKLASPNHYDEVMTEWIGFIKRGPSELRENIRIIVTKKPFPQLFTSLISNKIARFDLFVFNDKTTRRGSIFQVEDSTSLYELLLSNYQQAIDAGCPLWQLWPFEALKYHIRSFIAPIVLLIIGIVLSESDSTTSIVVSSLALGLLSKIIWEKWGSSVWKRKELFKN